MNQYLKEITLKTTVRAEMIDITGRVQACVDESGVKDGVCYIYEPHTTAALTINENADSDVVADIITGLEKIVPFDDGYRHSEGNSAAHIKSSLIGNSKTVFIEGGKLKLGTWQGIFFCEFDGPRSRKAWIKII